MNLLDSQAWPIWLVAGVMTIAAIVNWNTRKVHNLLSFPFILGGWALGLLHSAGVQPDGGTGGIGPAIAYTLMAFILFLPMLRAGGIGAGSVKLQMGFSAWAGAYYGWWDGLNVTSWAFLLTFLLIGAELVIVKQMKRPSGIEEFRQPAPRMTQAVAYQCIGSLGYVGIFHFLWMFWA